MTSFSLTPFQASGGLELNFLLKAEAILIDNLLFKDGGSALPTCQLQTRLKGIPGTPTTMKALLWAALWGTAAAVQQAQSEPVKTLASRL